MSFSILTQLGGNILKKGNWKLKTISFLLCILFLLSSSSSAFDSLSLQQKNNESKNLVSSYLEPPLKPRGEKESCRLNKEYFFSTYSANGNGSLLFYKWDYGDGKFSEWLPYKSGETVPASHSWKKFGSFSLRVKAKNTDGVESDWSEPLIIGVPWKIPKKDTLIFFTPQNQMLRLNRTFAQSFVQHHDTLSGIKLRFWRLPYSKGIITLSVREKLDGENLTKNSITSIGNPYLYMEGYIWIDLPDIKVEPEKIYFFVLEYEEILLDQYVCYNYGNPYKNGEGFVKLDNGTWANLDQTEYGLDFIFYTYYCKSLSKGCLFDTISEKLSDWRYSKRAT